MLLMIYVILNLLSRSPLLLAWGQMHSEFSLLVAFLGHIDRNAGPQKLLRFRPFSHMCQLAVNLHRVSLRTGSILRLHEPASYSEST